MTPKLSLLRPSPRFALGDVYQTVAVMNLGHPGTITSFLDSHSQCEWGEVTEEERSANDACVLQESTDHLLRSIHKFNWNPVHVLIWIVTDFQAKTTTIMLQEEYGKWPKPV